ncbi:MAG: serine/threonine protein kinase [Bacillariaceae sp.]|jgi:serine/threonine protein kinase
MDHLFDVGNQIMTDHKRQKGDVEQENTNKNVHQIQQQDNDLNHDDIVMTSFHNDDENYEDIGNRLLSPFGQDDIHEIRAGNSTFARGAFGELSIAVRRRSRSHSHQQSSSSSAAEHSSFSLYSFVAVKKIHNAITKDGGGGGSGGGGNFFGQSQQSSQSQQQQQQLSNEVFNELLALRLLHPHPNIATLVAVYPGKEGGSNHGSLSLVFPYCPMDLNEILTIRRRNFQQPLAFRFLKTILRDVFEAIAHCHDNGILHRDIKPGNLLVSSRGQIILCDFGLAKPFLSFEEENNEQIVPSNNINVVEKGLCTLYYRPIEILLGGPSAFPSVDMWSAGIVLTEMIAGWSLWPGRNVIDQLSLVFNALGTPNETTWPSVRRLPDYGKLNFGTKTTKRWENILPRAAESSMLVDLVSKLLKLNPTKRLTARQALDHYWLKENAFTSASANHRELRDELIQPSVLDIPPLLFPEKRELVEKLGLGVVEARISILSPSKQKNEQLKHCWDGPKTTALKSHDQLSELFRKKIFVLGTQ